MESSQLKKTTEVYDNNAAKYHAKFSKYEEYRRQVLGFADLLQPESRVLDMGCGTGVNAGLLSDAGHKVTGVDNSEGMLEVAAEHCRSAVFKYSSVLDYRPEDSYDAILLSFLIVHLTDDEADLLLRRVSGFLCRPGYLYISFMTGKAAGYETTSFSGSELFFNYYSSEVIRGKLEGEGFKLLRENSAPYVETDGTKTEDIFQIYTLL
ncbi:MAG: class I SAM-dependent methyltransferase [Spirochaetales bacterium]|nr:class I SAM-dependent methyltransferase [Spirochaetales bacterium]